MPVGVIVDAVAVIIGGVVGALAGSRLKDEFKDSMNLILGCCSTIHNFLYPVYVRRADFASLRSGRADDRRL